MPVIFCHGLEGGPHGSKYQALVAAGLEVVAPDFQGQDLAARVATLSPGTPPEEIEAAVEASMNRLGDSLLGQLEEAGLPLFTPDGASRVRFRATLVMPVPILRANTCVSGDTATWEFDEEDLYGRGFEMKALASAP